MTRVLVIAAAILTLSAGIAFAAADSFNFSFSTLPVPTTESGPDEGNLRVGLIYVAMKDDGPFTRNSFKLNGGGADLSLGKGLNDWSAWYWHTTAVGLVGTTRIQAREGLISMDFHGVGSPVTGTATMDTDVFLNAHDLTLVAQLPKGSRLRPLLFAGPTFSWALVKNSYRYDQTTLELIHYGAVPSDDSTQWMFLYGVQAGAALGISLGDFELAPLVLVKEQWGTLLSGNSSNSLSTFTEFAYGAEATYRPWGVKLSSVIHEAARSGNTGGVESTLVQVSWNHSWGP